MQGKIAVEEHFRIEETKGSEARYHASNNGQHHFWRKFWRAVAVLDAASQS